MIRPMVRGRKFTIDCLLDLIIVLQGSNLRFLTFCIKWNMIIFITFNTWCVGQLANEL